MPQRIRHRAHSRLVIALVAMLFAAPLHLGLTARALAQPAAGTTEIARTLQEAEWSLGCPRQIPAASAATIEVRGSGNGGLATNAGVFAGGSPAVSVSVDGTIEVQLTVPESASGTTAIVTLTAGNETADSCEIAVGAPDSDVVERDQDQEESSERSDRGPTFPGDGTDPSIGVSPTETPEPAATEGPTPIPGPRDDGTGILEALEVGTVPPSGEGGDPTATPKPTKTPEVTNTPVATATSTPENPIPTLVPATTNKGELVAQEIGPQGGELTTPFGAVIEIPQGVLQDLTSVTVQRIPDNNLPTVPSVDLVPDSGLQITLARPDGQMLDQLPQPALLRVDLGDRWRAGATLYQLSDGELIPLDDVVTKGQVLEAPISRVMRVVAGVPVATAVSAEGNNLVPFVLIALTSVIAAVVIGSLIGAARRRRPRSVPRRHTSRTRVRTSAGR